MKILIVSHYWFPEPSVPQKRWTWLSQMLADLGHDVFVVAPRTDLIGERAEIGQGPSNETVLWVPRREVSESITHRSLSQGAVAAKSVWYVLRAARRGQLPRPDLVIGTVPAIPTTFATFAIARMFSAPYAIDIRDAWPDLLKFGDSWNAGLGRRSYRERLLIRGPFQLAGKTVSLAMGSVFRKARVLFSTSERFAAVLKERFKDGPEVFVIRNVFPSLLESQAPLIKPVQGESLKVLYAGKLGRAQGLKNALEAVAQLRELGTPVQFRIVGAGAVSDALKADCTVLGLDSCVQFHDPVDSARLLEHYEWADTALVHLAGWEPLKMAVPSKTFELMRLGIPITAVIDGEAAELVQELSAGIVVPPEEPRALAEAWAKMWTEKWGLTVSGTASNWVLKEREKMVPMSLKNALNEVRDSGTDRGAYEG